MPNDTATQHPADLLMWRAADLSRRGKWLHAVQCYEQAIAEHSGNADAYLYLANIYVEREHWRAARDLLVAGVLLCPTDARLNVLLGNVHLNDDDHDRAITCYRTALKHDPGNPKALHNIGLALARSERNAEAISYLTKLWYARPEYPGLAELLGGTYVSIGRPDRALAVLQPAEQREPDNALVLHLTGLALCGLERWKEALGRLRRAAALREDDAETLRALGWTLVKLHCYDEAELWLRRAVEVQPDLLYAHMNLAVLFLLAGDVDACWETLQTARQLDPDNERLASFLKHWDEGGEIPEIAAIEGSYGSRRED